MFCFVLVFFGTKIFDKTHKLAYVLIPDHFRFNILSGVVNTAYISPGDILSFHCTIAQGLVLLAVVSSC